MTNIPFSIFHIFQNGGMVEEKLSKYSNLPKPSKWKIFGYSIFQFFNRSSNFIKKSSKSSILVKYFRNRVLLGERSASWDARVVGPLQSQRKTQSKIKMENENSNKTFYFPDGKWKLKYNFGR